MITGKGEKVDKGHGHLPPNTPQHRTKSLAKNNLAEDRGGGSGSTVFAVQTSGP